MFKKSALLFITLMLAACSYVENPRKFIKDPHFEQYKADRDKLESQYLRKEISYSEYVKKRDALDKKYDKEVQERNSKINE